jgi:hypothetical protein
MVGDLSTDLQPELGPDISRDTAWTRRATVPAAERDEVGPTRALHRHGPTALIVAVYTGIAFLAYSGAWLAHPMRLVLAGGALGDPGQHTWFLSITASALTHGRNPFVTTWANYPYGVNLVANTGLQLLGAVMTPLTLTAGPVVSFNLVMTLAFATSATAAYAMVRRWTSWPPAAFAGGLLYGFSPYMVGQGGGHADLVFVPLPPLMLLVIDEILVRQRGSAWRWGSVLGLLAMAQFFISAEILLTTALMAAIGLALLMATNRAAIATHAPFAIVALATATVIMVGFVAYPLWIGLDGPQHFHGPIQRAAQQYRGDLLGPILPTENQLLTPSWLAGIGDYLGGGTVENGSYLGLPLLATLVLATVILWRSRLVRLAALLAGAAFVLSLGAWLTVGGSPSEASHSGLPLPEDLLRRLPLFVNIQPDRLSLYVVLFAALIFGVFLDHLHQAWPRHQLLLPLAASLACLVPLIPDWPYATQSAAIPSYFTSPAVRAIPAGSVALVYPWPDYDHSQAMVWQASSGMRFKMPGGYFLLALPRTHQASYDGPPSVTEYVLNALYLGQTPARRARLRQEILSELRSWRVQTVIDAPAGKDPDDAIAFFTWLLGRAPVMSHGVAVWYGVGPLT